MKVAIYCRVSTDDQTTENQNASWGRISNFKYPDFDPLPLHVNSLFHGCEFDYLERPGRELFRSVNTPGCFAQDRAAFRTDLRQPAAAGR